MDSELAKIHRRLADLPSCFEPLKEFAFRYLSKGYLLQGDSIRLGRFRKYDHDHFHITIFPPAVRDWLVQKRSYEIPLDYLKLLSYLNGLALFDVRLFGFTPSMQESPPRLGRRKLQCLDLTTANETWIIGVKNPPVDSIYFGGASYTSSENSCYFMNEGGQVRALLKGGRLVKQWESLWRLIAEEGVAAEKRAINCTNTWGTT